MSRRRLKEQLQYEVFLVPVLISFTIFTIIPLLRTVLYSFTDFDGITHSYQFIGFENYVDMFQDSVVSNSIGNTLLYALGMVLIVNLLSVPLAVLLDNPAKSKTIERAVFFFPSVVSGLLLGFLWGYILSPTKSGALNGILSFFHMQPIPWLSDPVISKFCILGVGIWAATGWHTMVNIAYLQAVPAEYYEAAKIDGASRFQLFRHITIPMLAPALTINTLLLLTNGLKVYDIPFAMTSGGPGYSNYTVTQAIIQRGFSERQYGLSSAMSTTFILIVMIVAVIQYTTMSRREQDLS